MITAKYMQYALTDEYAYGDVIKGSHKAARMAYETLCQEGVVTLDNLKKVYTLKLIEMDMDRHDDEETHEDTISMMMDMDEFIMEFCKSNYLCVVSSEACSYIINAQVFLFYDKERFIQTEIGNYLDVFDMENIYERIALDFYGEGLKCKMKSW